MSDDFKAGMGAEAIKELLKDIDLDKLQRRTSRRSLTSNSGSEENQSYSNDLRL